MNEKLIFRDLDIPVIPVCVFDDVDSALTVARLALECGFETLEVTLRTEEAFHCLEVLKKKFPKMLLGAGTVFHMEEVDRLVDLGISYGVSPCFDRSLVEHALKRGLDFVPAVATPSELKTALEVVPNIKFFPAENMGGVAFIKSLASPFSSFNYGLIPTGGVNKLNFKTYLELENVQACGMTWVVDRRLIAQDDFAEIERRLKFVSREVGL